MSLKKMGIYLRDCIDKAYGLHEFLGDDSGELVAHINRKEYRQLWNDYKEGKITGTELTKILFRE